MIDKPISAMSVAELIRFTQGILATRSHDVVAPAMAEYAFTEEDYDEGATCLQALVESSSFYSDLIGQEKEAIAARDAHLDAFRQGDFADHVGRVRVAVGDSGPDADRLLLPGLTASTLSIPEWLERSQHFYTTLDADAALLNRVRSGTGLTRAMVTSGREDVRQALDLDTTYHELVTRRQQARRTRDEKRKDVEAWAARARDLAKLALKDNEAKEIFGIRYYTEDA